ncbi:hypothetical protein [Streptomyces acidicola]|uniref:hypothetical protein n=1 Tax=Streptomyces acidicola TaxID=2596892 RepID=UPI0034231A39
MAELLTDPGLLPTTFVTVDFETLTPAGRRPSPIEVAAQARKLTPDGTWRDEGRFEELIRPPQDVPVTGADTAQTSALRESPPWSPRPSGRASPSLPGAPASAPNPRPRTCG